mmetsp:Transcript_57568/g.130575  ORF Transcript_57568/g.130575 Transcript_57568/m.130575 type:complete len:300 (-) Transcript_57568:295-1194(-)
MVVDGVTSWSRARPLSPPGLSSLSAGACSAPGSRAGHHAAKHSSSSTPNSNTSGASLPRSARSWPPRAGVAPPLAVVATVVAVVGREGVINPPLRAPPTGVFSPPALRASSSSLACSRATSCNRAKSSSHSGRSALHWFSSDGMPSKVRKCGGSRRPWTWVRLNFRKSTCSTRSRYSCTAFTARRQGHLSPTQIITLSPRCTANVNRGSRGGLVDVAGSSGKSTRSTTYCLALEWWITTRPTNTSSRRVSGEVYPGDSPHLLSSASSCTVNPGLGLTVGRCSQTRWRASSNGIFCNHIK